MFEFKKIAAASLIAATAAVPCFGWDFFWPDESFFSDCRRVMPPPPCGMTRYAYSEETVTENNEGFSILLVTPGVPKEDYSISVKNGVLGISICKKECQAKKADKKADKQADKKCGKKCPKAAPGFFRAYKLPPNVDQAKIKAAYRDGVMQISIPKVKEPDKPEIKIAIE